VAKVREAVGRETTLMVDANQSWRVDEAIARARQLERFNLYWLEEPLEATDLDGFARLGRQTTIARAGGESLYSTAAFHESVRRGALDILQPDVARVGGITKAIQVCHMAAAAGLVVAPHVSPELSVTVAAAVSNSVFVEYIPQMEPILKRPVMMQNGAAMPLDTPGHGIEFDAHELDRFTVRRVAIDSSDSRRRAVPDAPDRFGASARS
jgi:L-alanine-DL-glutamate epimerase-like enolase superfamily enzyme